MELILVHREQDAELRDAWRERFGSCADVRIVAGDICGIACDAIVSPANSFGFMDGGLDARLSEFFGWDLQSRLQAEIARRPMGELLVGEAIAIATHHAVVPWLISAPTMRVPMQIRESVNAYLAMKAILTCALANGFGTIACPGLGTGSGQLDPRYAAGQMWAAYREIVLNDRPYPTSFVESQRRYRSLNPDARLS